MNLRRGSVPDRFEKIKALYLEVAKSALGQIDREATILEAYKDFRMALKASEIEAQELLQVASKQLASRKDALAVASRDVESFASSRMESKPEAMSA